MRDERWHGSGYGCLFMVAVGCSAADGPSSEWPMVHDSSGVQIVEVGPLDERMAFRVGAEPEYVLGWAPGDYLFQFGNAGVLLSDGRAAVTDRGAGEIVVIARSGVVESVLGGRGEGPGEFSGLGSIAIYGADTIVAQEAFRRRSTFFHEGGVTRTLTVVDLPSTPLYAAIGIDDRARMILHPSSFPVGFAEPWLRDAVLRMDLRSGDVDTLRVFDSRQNTGAVPYPPAFGAVGFAAGSIVIGRSDRPQIEVVDFEGRTTRIVRWEEARPEMTDAFWAAYEVGYVELRPGLQEPELSRRLAELREERKQDAHFLPYFRRRFVGDDLGNVWVPEYGPDQRFDQRYRVFSSEGEWVGWVHMPDRFQALNIRDGRMLGVHLDEFSVPAVAVYRLEE